MWSGELNIVYYDMKNYFKKLLPILIAGLIPVLSNAQKSSSIPEWERKIHKVLRNDKSQSALKDSLALYSFNLKLNITKNETGKARIKQITVNDNLFYKIFPEYKDFYSINYRALMKNRKKVNLIIPVIIYNTSPTAISKYNRQGNVALINIETAANILSKSFSFIKEDKSQEYIFIDPRVIHVINQKDKEPTVTNHKPY